MNIKRITAFAVCLLLLLTLFACKEKNGTADSELDAITQDSNESDTDAKTEFDSENSTDAYGTESDSSDTYTSAPETTETDAPSTNPPVTDPPATKAPVTDPPKQETTAPPVKTCNHSNTEVRNKKDATTSAEGYTGDTYCKDCGKLISSGSATPKIKQTVAANHDFYDVEMKIFNGINEERKKAGLSALVWDEELYAGTKIRVKEYSDYYEQGIGTGPHSRPDGSMFFTAVTGTSDYSESSFDCWGENCAADSGTNDFVSGWMASPGHRANILNGNFSRAAIAVYYVNYTYYATNIFVG